jgi:hypothetical protein
MADYMNMAKLSRTPAKCRKAFSLVETVTVLTITAMLVLAVLGIYNRVKASAAAINRTLDKNLLSTEVLQRIAEDLDRLAVSGFDTKISIANRLDASGYNITQLIIQNTVYGDNNISRIFEKIIWQTYYDPFEESLILYRCHDGINLEDKVITDDLQAERQKAGTALFIPLCTGITFFKIRVPTIKNLVEESLKEETYVDYGEQSESEKFLDKWTDNKLPKAVTVTISFGQPYEAVTGELDVPENEKITRTIAIDRTRKIAYKFIRKEFAPEDANDINSSQASIIEPEIDEDDKDKADDR